MKRKKDNASLSGFESIKYIPTDQDALVETHIFEKFANKFDLEGMSQAEREELMFSCGFWRGLAYGEHKYRYNNTDELHEEDML